MFTLAAKKQVAKGGWPCTLRLKRYRRSGEGNQQLLRGDRQIWCVWGHLLESSCPTWYLDWPQDSAACVSEAAATHEASWYGAARGSIWEVPLLRVWIHLTMRTMFPNKIVNYHSDIISRISYAVLKCQPAIPWAIPWELRRIISWCCGCCVQIVPMGVAFSFNGISSYFLALASRQRHA